MVGRRNRDFVHGDGARRRPSAGGGRDVQPSRKLPLNMRFRDAADMAVEDQRREEIKKKLIHGIDRDSLETYRKSHDEVCRLAFWC